ncbi:hypothetical protein SDC9_37693 [bioreactor metagenome]|uniref:Uncharacterized protein n=1 Tax=bioreactor metagenome TaxID=1076179 RepID=A0A644VK43_9ZZZZ
MEISTLFSEVSSGDAHATCAVLSCLFFGWTIGSHYTEAMLGMAYGVGVIKSPRLACLLGRADLRR